jgi:hypothetical protein
VFESN